MKRDPRLIEFSREHHQALKLGKYLENTISVEKGNVELEQYRIMLLAHFTEEEQMLNHIVDTLDLAVKARFHNDHAELRNYLKKGILTISELQQLGTLLISHTRFEERELFQMIQEQWD